MQALLRQAAEPVLQAVARSCRMAGADVIGTQHPAAATAAAACTAGAARLFATAGDGGESQPVRGPDVSGGPALGQPGSHRYGQPYKPDLRRFVHPDTMSPRPVYDTGALPPPQPDLVQQLCAGLADGAACMAPPGPSATGRQKTTSSTSQRGQQQAALSQYLAGENAAVAEQRQAALRQVIQDFQRFEGDTGSSEVQVALLTTRIAQLAEHMREHRKDFSSRRGLEAALSQRRRLLQYLRRTDFEAYAHLISRLGLRDTYTKLDRVTLQIQQRRIRGASKPHKKRRK